MFVQSLVNNLQFGNLCRRKILPYERVRPAAVLGHFARVPVGQLFGQCQGKVGVAASRNQGGNTDGRFAGECVRFALESVHKRARVVPV